MTLISSTSVDNSSKSKNKSVTSIDTRNAVFSSIIYNGLHKSGQNSSDILNRSLKDPNVIKYVGTDWSVHKSNQDAALLINQVTKEIVLVCRGTSTLFRDFLRKYWSMGSTNNNNN